jgi:hypothetical protein
MRGERCEARGFAFVRSLFLSVSAVGKWARQVGLTALLSLLAGRPACRWLVGWALGWRRAPPSFFLASVFLAASSLPSHHSLLASPHSVVSLVVVGVSFVVQKIKRDLIHSLPLYPSAWGLWGESTSGGSGESLVSWGVI